MDKYVLVEYLSTTKSAIYETFKSTQRIKLISFDVSKNFIILGTSSGGIYIFKRTPCEFLRLIPSKEGPTVQVKISQNENNLAIASSKGLVIILENVFVDLNIRPFLYADHVGNTVTVLKWHGNDLYCGDNTGKLSVCSPLSTLTQAIFQSPSSTLMHLDSSIVQIDAYKNYLLISTRTRTYLCDTEREQYKQIGKKLRDGHFGAVFSQTDATQYSDPNESFRKAFKTLESEEKFNDNLNNNNVKIYCSRPGARLWIANFQATVLATHQFKTLLNKNSSSIITIESNNKNEKLNISKFSTEEISKDFNFGRLYLLYPNIILTYDSKGIYFFNVESSSLLCWSHIYYNIRDIKILKPYIYIWRNDLQINIVSLQSLEELVISTLFNKQYFLCMELCVNFNEDIINMIGISKKINLISVLDAKLKELGSEELPGELLSILDKLKERYSGQKLGIKLENGIVVVDNQYSNQNLSENVIHDDSPPEKEDLLILYKQYVLNKTHKLAELTESSNILNNSNLNDLPSLFASFIDYIEAKYQEDASLWCKQQMVKHASKNIENLEYLDSNTINYLSKSFIQMNDFQKDSCKCIFPLPGAHKRKIEHFVLATELYDLSDDKNGYLFNIPLLYKHMIRKMQDIKSEICLLIQFSDKEVFKEFLSKISYDTWDEGLKLFIKLRKGNCLNCTEKIPTDGVLSWTEIGILMVESIGAKFTTRLLKRYGKFIPRGELNYEFYQSCIFSMTSGDTGLSVAFVEATNNAGNSKKLGDCMEQFLNKKYLGNSSQTRFTFNKTDDNSAKCCYCNLPVTHPVLVDIKRCDCDRTYHQICFSSNHNICKFCVSVSSS